MSHNHGTDGENIGDEEGCSMQMIFHMDNCETILFKAWTVKDVGGFVAVCIALFIISMLYEGLKYFREKLYQDAREYSEKEGSTEQLRNGQQTLRQKIWSKPHFIQTFLHLIQVAASYALMLIVMTYNVWLLLAVVLGACTGYFCFGWIRDRSLDVTEHCH